MHDRRGRTRPVLKCQHSNTAQVEGTGTYGTGRYEFELHRCADCGEIVSRFPNACSHPTRDYIRTDHPPCSAGRKLSQDIERCEECGAEIAGPITSE
jgi:uncharacterized protein with PIN domain